MYIILKCKQCDADIRRHISKYRYDINKRTKNTFCNVTCYANFYRRTTKCPACGVLFPGANKYCSRTCLNKHLGYCSTSLPKEVKFCLHCSLSCKTRSLYCSTVCRAEAVFQKKVKDWISGKLKITSNNFIRKYLFRVNATCWQCSWAEIHPVTGKIPIEVDHINGDCLDNRIENLRLLCPNCHSMTSTYRGLNKNSGRRKRKEYMRKFYRD